MLSCDGQILTWEAGADDIDGRHTRPRDLGHIAPARHVGIVPLQDGDGVVVDFNLPGDLKAGLLKPRLYRPFPYDEISQALKHLKAVAVLDRSDSFGSSFGPLYLDIVAALNSCAERPVLINKIFGLGGRDYMPDQGEQVLDELLGIAQGAPVRAAKEYIGVRGSTC